MKVSIWIQEDLLENFEQGLNSIYERRELNPKELVAIRLPYFVQNPMKYRDNGDFIQIFINSYEFVALNRYKDEVAFDE